MVTMLTFQVDGHALAIYSFLLSVVPAVLFHSVSIFVSRIFATRTVAGTPWVL